MVQLTYDYAVLTMCEVEVYGVAVDQLEDCSVTVEDPITFNVSNQILPPGYSLDLTALNDGLQDTCTIIDRHYWTVDGILNLGVAAPFHSLDFNINASAINFQWHR